MQPAVFVDWELQLIHCSYLCLHSFYMKKALSVREIAINLVTEGGFSISGKDCQKEERRNISYQGSKGTASQSSSHVGFHERARYTGLS